MSQTCILQPTEQLLGKMNRLNVIKPVKFGVYLDGGELGDIILPTAQVPKGVRAGSKVDVFVYYDAENRLRASISRPYGLVGEVAFLQVKTVNEVGAFLDWGIPKDLFVPFNEQSVPLKERHSYLVYVFFDKTSGRIAGSTRLSRWFARNPVSVNVGDEVSLIIGESTDSGFKAVINNGAWGFLYHNDIFEILREGQRKRGFVKNIREDGKIDLYLQKPGYEKISGIAESIFSELRRRGGFIKVTDKSSADTIKGLFGISKKNYKKAVGALLKAKKITLQDDGIALKKLEE